MVDEPIVNADPPAGDPPASDPPVGLLDAEGNFTDTYRTGLPGMLGDEHKDSKAMDDIKSVGDLTRAYVNTKKMVGQKVENVIPKITDKSTDEEKAAFRTAINEANGFTGKVEDYQLPRIEGVEYSEAEVANEDAFKQICIEKEIPHATAAALTEFFNAGQVASMAAGADAETEAFQEECKSIRNDWRGGDLTGNLRTAYKAIQVFGTEALQTKLAESGIYGTPDNLDQWRGLGFGPDQLRIWANVGKQMLPADILKGEPISGNNISPERAAAIKQYPNSPTLWPK